MKKDWKYIIYLVGALAIYFIFALSAPREYDWRTTLSREDKIPFGTYALAQLLPGIFEGKDITNSNLTIYETMDSLKGKPINFISISNSFNIEGPDLTTLLNNVAAGGHAFISSNSFYGAFSDTLLFSSDDYYYMNEHNHFWSADDDSTVLTFTNPTLGVADSFKFPRQNLREYLTIDKEDIDATVIARNDVDLPVTIRIKWGKGAFILNSTPLAFSNVYLLDHNNYRFATTTLSHLPVNDLIWTEYYQGGRLESRTPLRFILSDEALQWAYYLVLFSLLAFFIFEAKRRQRIIPVIKPMENTTLEFVETIGDLYFQSQDHKNIAEKKINYFMEHLRVKYWLAPRKLDEPFIHALAKKSGKPEKDVRALIETIQAIQHTPYVNEHQLIDLNRKLEIFYEHH